MDVISLLQKKQQDVTGFEVRVWQTGGGTRAYLTTHWLVYSHRMQ
jgi:hypothetical protein